MTYNVFGGTFNLAQSINTVNVSAIRSSLLSEQFAGRQCLNLSSFHSPLVGRSYYILCLEKSEP